MLDHHWRMVNLVVFVLITIATGVNALCRIADGKFTGVHQYALVFFGLFTLFLSVVTVMTMLRTSAHRRKWSRLRSASRRLQDKDRSIRG